MCIIILSVFRMIMSFRSCTFYWLNLKNFSFGGGYQVNEFACLYGNKHFHYYYFNFRITFSKHLFIIFNLKNIYNRLFRLFMNYFAIFSGWNEFSICFRTTHKQHKNCDSTGLTAELEFVLKEHLDFWRLELGKFECLFKLHA